MIHISPRTGRPKSETPKHTQLGVRFDDETLKQLDKLVDHYQETRVEVIRRGVKKLYSELESK